MVNVGNNADKERRHFINIADCVITLAGEFLEFAVHSAIACGADTQGLHSAIVGFLVIAWHSNLINRKNKQLEGYVS